MTPPINIDGTQITGASIDGQTVSKITVDGTQVFTRIPDSVGNRYFAPDQSETDGQTVGTFDDEIGSIDLVASGAPTLQESQVNNTDAVSLDGTDDGYDYDPNVSSDITEPCSILFSLNVASVSSGVSVFWRDEDPNGNFQLLNDNGNYRFINKNDDNRTGPGSVVFGDQIFSILIDDTDAVLRVNGSNRNTITSESGIVVLTSSDNGSFFYEKSGDRRYVNTDIIEGVIHPNTRLTGSDLTDEEQRLESNASMNVLS